MAERKRERRKDSVAKKEKTRKELGKNPEKNSRKTAWEKLIKKKHFFCLKLYHLY